MVAMMIFVRSRTLEARPTTTSWDALACRHRLE
jgi:hypothetical protein